MGLDSTKMCKSLIETEIAAFDEKLSPEWICADSLYNNSILLTVT